ncbi:MAG: DUF962 domain-containing protein [Halobacteriales archaeon]|nr:DUF962 domain-containing protein [Halobacteriales archaeon]
MKSLPEQMAVYAAYHRDGSNRAIHFLFVPLIVWSAMGLLALPGSVEAGGLAVTAAHVASLALLAYYLRLDVPLGVAMAVLFTVLLTTALELDARLGAAALPFFAAVFALSWAAQLVGHRFFEGRKPALMDDLWQVFVAPVFVVAEWAFALGLRRKLRDEVERGLQAHLPKA